MCYPGRLEAPRFAFFRRQDLLLYESELMLLGVGRPGNLAQPRLNLARVASARRR